MPARFPDTTFVNQPKTTESQAQHDPSSTCQLIEKSAEKSIRTLGSQNVLKYRRYDYDIEAEMENIDFVAEKTTLPVPRIVVVWEEGNRILSIQGRLEGESLEKALPNLTQEDIERIGKQVGEYLGQLKHITSPLMEMLDKQPVVDRRLFKPMPNSTWRSYSGCATDAEVRVNLSIAIDDNVNLTTMHALMNKMPSAEPFTFSHSDVHEKNIMVKDGNFVGLIHWGLAGFYPSWWEFVNSCELVGDHFPAEFQNMAALEWFTVYQAVRDRPNEPKTLAIIPDYGS
ncbi:kinase-like protein [Annulohypoxylon bovei var. microspora]|nr:kinase-like protein [Annulohypoxylon bovei var. microspora]